MTPQEISRILNDFANKVGDLSWVLILVVVLSLSLYLLMSSSNEQANNRNTRLVQQTRAAEVANKISSTSSLLHNRAFSKKERLRDTIGSAKSILISCPLSILKIASSTNTVELISLELVGLLKDMASLPNLKIYLLVEIQSTDIQKGVLQCLQNHGIICSEKKSINQIPSHRVLFCSTSIGKVAFVRQIEPEIYIDSDSDTLESLGRITSGFIPRRVHIWPSGDSDYIPNSTNLETVSSFISVLQWCGYVEADEQCLVDFKDEANGLTHQVVIHLFNFVSSNILSEDGKASIEGDAQIVACDNTLKTKYRNDLKMNEIIAVSIKYHTTNIDFSNSQGSSKELLSNPLTKETIVNLLAEQLKIRLNSN